MNLDATGLRLVRKGAAVQLGERVGLVVKLCRGNCLVLWEDERYALPESCKTLTVV